MRSRRIRSITLAKSTSTVTSPTSIAWLTIAVPRRIAHLGEEPRASDDGLRRNAPDIEAIAAEEIAFDERHRCAECRGGVGRGSARGSAADDHEIITIGRRGIGPVGRVDVAEALALIRVIRHSHPPLKPARCRPWRI